MQLIRLSLFFFGFIRLSRFDWTGCLSFVVSIVQRFNESIWSTVVRLIVAPSERLGFKHKLSVIGSHFSFVLVCVFWICHNSTELSYLFVLINFFLFLARTTAMAPRQCCSSLIAFLLVIIVPTTQCFSLYDIGYRLEQDLQAEVHNFFDRQMVAEEPDVHMTTDQMIRMRGYQSESHFVTTDDCYVLHLFRIVVPPSAGRFHSASKYRPVIIQHGLLGSSVDFVLNTVGGSLSDQDNHNLAFVLARNGFDVWLSNVRGNRYSRNHTKYNPDQSMPPKVSTVDHC